tara:strand:- start:307 stop:687 length:381 start_codon:yes stop_codon:yes gene_type:complete
MDGKTQIDELNAKVNALAKQNKVLSEKYRSTKANLLIEAKTANLSEGKKSYLRKILIDKTPEFIEENFEYTAKLFDKKEKERLTVIKEEAYKKRKVKTDAPVQQISEKKEEKQYNPYLAELERSHK